MTLVELQKKNIEMARRIRSSHYFLYLHYEEPAANAWQDANAGLKTYPTSHVTDLPSVMQRNRCSADMSQVRRGRPLGHGVERIQNASTSRQQELPPTEAEADQARSCGYCNSSINIRAAPLRWARLDADGDCDAPLVQIIEGGVTLMWPAARCPGMYTVT